MTVLMDVSADQITKCGERSIRKPCQGCGRTDLWWGHYVRGNGQDRKVCHKHSGSQLVTFTLVEANGSQHACSAGKSSDAEHDESTSEVQPETAKSASTYSAPATPDTANIAELLAQLFANSVSPERVNALFDQRWESQGSQFKTDMIDTIGRTIRERLDSLSVPVTVEVKTERETKTLTGVHKTLPLVLAAASAGENVMMVGPMGTGKSTIAAHVAKSLDLPFMFMAVGPQTSKSDILGYMTADGVYVPSLFRKIYESGGIFLFDELDAAHPGVLTIINSALSNGHMAFPDGMVARHADTLVFAAANTYGRGPDRMYVGRQAIDAATLDRFTVVEIEVDEALETNLCYSTGLDAGKCDKVLSYVRYLRKSAIDHKMAVGFSPRASVGMCRLVKAGFTTNDAIDARVRRGLSDQDWSKVSAGAPRPVGL